jgi:membrane-bound lytic murein transglycosylase F
MWEDTPLINTKRRMWAGKIEQNLGSALVAALCFYPFILWAQPGDASPGESPNYADLQDIIKRGALSVLYQRDQHDGAYPVSSRERVMLEQFAREHHLTLDWIAVDTPWNLIPQLVAGKGDIIVGQGPTLAAGMVDQASFTSPWLAQHQQVVVRTDTTRIRAPEDLGYRQVALKQSSPAWPVMKHLAEQYPTMDLVTIPEYVKYDIIMARVASGQYDVTIADSDFLHYYLPDHPELSVAYDLGASIEKAWAVNTGAGQLQKTLEQFLFMHQLEWSIAEYASQAGSPVGNSNNSTAEQSGQLSPYDDLVRKYSDKYGFDWRLIVAQMYQESQFDPGALSDAGAEGLMQMLPETATTIGVNNLADPEANIRAGVKYLSHLRNQFEPDLLLEERTWFTLASYNAGPGRVNRARQLAVKMGLDPNHWFGNVETAMLALAEPVLKDGEMVRNCRCGQTVIYVKEIRRLYHNYVRLTRAGQVASTNILYTRPYDI